MTALPNTRDALGESWTSTSRRARRIARHSRHAAEDIAGELRTLMSELESTLADGTQADAVALRGKLRKQLDVARDPAQRNARCRARTRRSGDVRRRRLRA